MSAALDTIRAAGLSVRLGDANTLKVTPAELLTPDLRELIRTHKHSLVLTLAALEQDDRRVTCITCLHLKPGNRCTNYRRAGLTAQVLAGQFVGLRQHCPGFASRGPP